MAQDWDQMSTSNVVTDSPVSRLVFGLSGSIRRAQLRQMPEASGSFWAKRYEANVQNVSDRAVRAEVDAEVTLRTWLDKGFSPLVSAHATYMAHTALRPEWLARHSG